MTILKRLDISETQSFTSLPVEGVFVVALLIGGMLVDAVINFLVMLMVMVTVIVIMTVTVI